MSLEVTSHSLLVLFLVTLCPEARVLQAYPAYPLRRRAFKKCNGSAIFFFNLLIDLFLAVLGLCSCASFSLVAASGGYSLVAMHGILIVVTSRVAQNRL